MVSVFVGILAYATTACAFAADNTSQVAPALLRIDRYDPPPSRERGVETLLELLHQRTSIDTPPQVPVTSLSAKNLFFHPFLILLYDRELPLLSQADASRLRSFLLGGGFLLVDVADAPPNGPFAPSMVSLLKRLFPTKPLVEVPTDHVIYSSFYLLDLPYGRLAPIRPDLGLFHEGRLMVMLHPSDLFGALSRTKNNTWSLPQRDPAPRSRELAQRFAVNIALYVLTLEYKSDQAHLPFVMARRKWQTSAQPSK